MDSGTGSATSLGKNYEKNWRHAIFGTNNQLRPLALPMRQLNTVKPCMVIAKTLTRNQTGNMDIVCIAIHFVGVCWAAPSGMLLDVLKFWEHARVFVLRASAGFLRKLGWLVALPSECIESQWIMIAVSGWRSMLDTKKNYRLCIIDCNSLHFMVVQNVFHCVSVISKTRLLECWETRASRLKNVHHQNHVRQDLVYIGNMLAL